MFLSFWHVPSNETLRQGIFRYFAILAYDNWVLFMLIRRSWFRLFVKFTWTDFVSFNFILHYFVQPLIFLTEFFRFFVLMNVSPSCHTFPNARKIVKQSFPSSNIFYYVFLIFSVKNMFFFIRLGLYHFNILFVLCF